VVTEARTGRGGGYSERQEVKRREHREESDDEYDDYGRKKKKCASMSYNSSPVFEHMRSSYALVPHRVIDGRDTVWSNASACARFLVSSSEFSLFPCFCFVLFCLWLAVRVVYNGAW